jgi:hypothetical protein
MNGGKIGKKYLSNITLTVAATKINSPMNQANMRDPVLHRLLNIEEHMEIRPSVNISDVVGRE